MTTTVDKRFHHLTSTKIRLKCTVALKVNHSTGRRQRKVTVSEGEEEVDVGEEVDGEADEEGEEEEEQRRGGRKRKLGREERRRETKDLNPRFESQIRITIILDVYKNHLSNFSIQGSATHCLPCSHSTPPPTSVWPSPWSRLKMIHK